MWGFAGLFGLAFAALLIMSEAGRRPIVLPDGPAGLSLAEAVIARAPRTLIVAAHPDDVEWYMGGTVARLVDAGAEVTVVIATDGEARRGGELTGAALGAVRREEQIEASRRLGVTDVRFLGLPDGRLLLSPSLTARVRAIWQDVQPELVFGFDFARTRFGYVHPDHLATGMAVARVAGEPLRAGAEVWLFYSREPDIAVDTTRTVERKVHALLAHRTQVGAGAERLLRSHSNSGATIGSQAGVQYAEAYRRLPLPR
jgi:LmbE family N-acetylglucosaminyl deacetylase